MWEIEVPKLSPKNDGGVTQTMNVFYPCAISTVLDDQVSGTYQGQWKFWKCVGVLHFKNVSESF